jgi:heme exporter protein C
MYLISWRIYESEEKVFKITTLITILGIVNVPIIKYSVDWWNTLHQPASINILSKSSIHSSMLFPFADNDCGICSFFIANFLNEI